MSVLRDSLRYPDLQTLEQDLRNAYQSAYNSELSKTNNDTAAASRAGSKVIVCTSDTDKWRINKKTYSFASFETAVSCFDILYEQGTSLKVKGASSLDEVVDKYFETLADLTKSDTTFSSSIFQKRLIDDIVKSPNFSKILPNYLKHFQENLDTIIQQTLEKNKQSDYVTLYMYAIDYFVAEKFIKKEEIPTVKKLTKALPDLISSNMSSSLLDVAVDAMSSSDLSNILSQLKYKKRAEGELVRKTCDVLLNVSDAKLSEVFTIENYKSMTELIAKFDLKELEQKLQKLNSTLQIVQTSTLDGELEAYTSLLEKDNLPLSEIEEFIKSTSSLKTFGCVKHNGGKKYSAFLYGMLHNVSKEALQFLYEQSRPHNVTFFDFIRHEYGHANLLTNPPTEIYEETLKHAVECFESFNSKSLEKYFEALSELRNPSMKRQFAALTLESVLNRYSKNQVEIRIYDESTAEMLQPLKKELLDRNILIVGPYFKYDLQDWDVISKNSEIDEHTKYQLLVKILRDSIHSLEDIKKHAERLRVLKTDEKGWFLQELATFKADLPKALELLKECNILDPFTFANYTNSNAFALLLESPHEFPYLSKIERIDDTTPELIEFDAKYNKLFVEKDFDDECMLEQYVKKFSKFPTSAIQSIIKNNNSDRTTLEGLQNMLSAFDGFVANSKNIAAQFDIAKDLDATAQFLKNNLDDGAYARFIEEMKNSVSKKISNSSYWIPKSLYDVYSKYVDVPSLDRNKNRYKNDLSFILTFKLTSFEELGPALEGSLHNTLERSSRRSLNNELLESEINDLTEILRDQQLIIDLSQHDLSSFVKKLNQVIQEVSDGALARKIELCKIALSLSMTMDSVEETAKRKKKLNF